MLMAGPSVFANATAIKQYGATQQQEIEIQPISTQSSLQTILLSIDESMVVPTERPSMIIFTSGTSGPPKGVVHTRRYLNVPYTPQVPGIFLNCVSLWTIGAIRLLKHTLSGCRIEIIQPDPSVLWERLRKGGVEFLAAVPPVWQRMMVYFQQHLDHLPAVQREEYLRGLRRLQTSLVNGGTLIPSGLRFWQDLGRPLELCYGATELGMICLMAGQGANAHRNVISHASLSTEIPELIVALFIELPRTAHVGNNHQAFRRRSWGDADQKPERFSVVRLYIILFKNLLTLSKLSEQPQSHQSRSYGRWVLPNGRFGLARRE